MLKLAYSLPTECVRMQVGCIRMMEILWNTIKLRAEKWMSNMKEKMACAFQRKWLFSEKIAFCLQCFLLFFRFTTYVFRFDFVWNHGLYACAPWNSPKTPMLAFMHVDYAPIVGWHSTQQLLFGRLCERVQAKGRNGRTDPTRLWCSDISVFRETINTISGNNKYFSPPRAVTHIVHIWKWCRTTRNK